MPNGTSSFFVLGKLLIFALFAVAAGVLLGLVRNTLTEALSGILFLTGSTILVALALLTILLLIEGLLFRGPDRYTRFN